MVNKDEYIPRFLIRASLGNTLVDIKRGHYFARIMLVACCTQAYRDHADFTHKSILWIFPAVYAVIQLHSRDSSICLRNVDVKERELEEEELHKRNGAPFKRT